MRQVKLPSAGGIKLERMVRRANKVWLAAIAAALMLFAQYVVAAEQCEVMASDDAGCLVHCLAQDQQASSLDQHFNVLPFVPALSAVFFAPVESRMPLYSLHQELLPGGPPRRVLFCSYLA